MNDEIKQGSQIESSINGGVVAVLKAASGTVVAVAKDGSVRELKAGDHIYAGEVIEAAGSESALIEMPNGIVRELSSGEGVRAIPDVLAALPEYQSDNPLFEELLAAIEAGEDISEKLDKPAAGESSGGASDETGQGAVFARQISEVNPQAGFDPDLQFPAPINPTANTEIVEDIGTPPPPPAPNVISIGDDSVVEGGVLQFTVTRSGADLSSTQSVTVNTSNGSAQAPGDYGAVTNLVVTFGPGETTKVVQVATVDDEIDEPTENLNITLSAPTGGATIGDGSAIGTITDNDTTNVSVSVNAEGGLVPEGEDAVFTVQVTGAAAGDTLALSLAPSGSDPATEGADYKATTFEYSTDGGASWTSTIEGAAIALSPGNSSLLVRTDTFDDGFDEADETFDLTATISDSGAVEKDTASATATIVDNDLRVEINADGIGDVVDETALPEGYIPDSDGEFAHGSFTFINSGQLDDLESVTIEGTTILMANFQGSVISTDHGKITITTYNSATGVATYTYQLLGPVSHASGPVNDLISISVTDGTNSASAEITVGIKDDGPVSTDKNGVLNNALGQSLVGVIDYDTNADGLGSPVSGGVTLSLNGTSAPLKSGGKTVFISIQDGNGDGLQELIGYVDTNSNSSYDAGEEVFTLSANPGNGDAGVYTLALHDVLDLPVTTIEQGFGQIKAGGPEGVVAVYTDATQTESNLLLSGDRINPSNGYVGAGGDNNMNAGEKITLEFGDVNLTTFEVGPRLVVNDAVFETKDIGAGGSVDTFTWTAIKGGSTVGSGTQTFDGGSKTSAIHVDGGYDTLILNVTAGGFKLGTLTYTDTTDPVDIDLIFGYSVTDADGDTVSGDFTATVSGAQPTLLSSTGDFIAHLDSADDSFAVI